MVPVVFAPAAGRLWSPVDAKPKRERELVRVRNVRARPEVSLLLDDYGEDWSRLWWLRVDALAHVIEPLDPSSDPAVAAAVDALRRKYPQYEKVDVLRDPPTLLAMAPRAVRSWCAGRDAIPEL